VAGADPGFVGLEVFQFWEPSLRKRIQNYEENEVRKGIFI
jgi:hypothetical protein